MNTKICQCRDQYAVICGTVHIGAIEMAPCKRLSRATRQYDSASRHLTLDDRYSKESAIPTTPWTMVIGNLLENKADSQYNGEKVK